MSAEVVFVAAYAVVLLGVARVLDRLGRISTDAWASRLVAAYRAQVPDAPRPGHGDDWPHSEVPRLYSGLAAVASTAATVLCLAETLRHQAWPEVALAAVIAVAGAITTARLLARLRLPCFRG